MDQAGLRAWEAKCTQEEPPGCQAGCPLEVDCRGFLSAMAKGELKKGRAILEKRLPIPEIAARLCEAPCESHCLRNELGGPVAIGLLERSCIEREPSATKILRLPPRAKTVLVIGGGPSALTATLDLARKGYPVRLCHLGSRPGGWLQGLETLPEAALTQELSRLQSLGVIFRSVPALNANLLGQEEYDAVYIGQDDDLSRDLCDQLRDVDHRTFATGRAGLFSGGFAGCDHSHRFITDLFQGRQAALSIDRFLQNASLTADRPQIRNGATRLYTNTAGVIPQPRTTPQNPRGYSPYEACQEAERCLQCQCLECVRNCVYLQQFGGYPKSYARQIYNNSAIVKGVHQANLLIDSCALCEQCTQLCPNDFSMAELCLAARRQMVAEERMPPSAHGFALEEMYSAGGEGALALHAPGEQVSRRLFFPGCQLSGLRPDQTLRLYQRLQDLEPRTGIWLDCCAIPAHWAGREQECRGLLARLVRQWQTLGSPQVVTACSSCLKMFRDHLPQIEAVPVWSILARHEITQAGDKRTVTVADPCTARHDIAVQRDVRHLLGAAGLKVEELAMSGTLTQCCGFGGLMENANPDLARRVAFHRADQAQAELLTYCAMCQDQLARAGKPVLHILDILFSESAQPADSAPQRLSDRRINRRRLKARLLAAHPEVEQPAVQPWQSIPLVIEEEAARQMETRRILEDDVRQVLAGARDHGTLFHHGKNGTLIASRPLGAVIFWVQYHKEDETIHVERCWSHRMEIAGRVTP